MSRQRASFECGDCGRTWQQYLDDENPVVCPSCESGNVNGWPILPTDEQRGASIGVARTSTGDDAQTGVSHRRSETTDEAEHVVAFLTAEELRDLDDDPVLTRRDYWRESQ